MADDFSLSPFNEHEVDLHIDQDPASGFVARVLHRPTMTLKISDWSPTAAEAVAQVIADLDELLKQRLQGLGR